MAKKKVEKVEEKKPACMGNCKTCGKCGKCNVLENVHTNFVAVSQNSKLGTMSATYSSHNSCPFDSCPFKRVIKVDGIEKHGCYGECGFVVGHWRYVDEGKTGGPYYTLLNQMERKGCLDMIRVNVCGDIAKPGTNDISEEIVNEWTKAIEGKNKKVFTYTHCAKSEHNFEIVKKAIEKGFAINFSCEKLEDVKKVIEAGLPAVLVVNTMKDKVVKKDGIVYMHCPNQEDGRKCNACKICTNAKRKVVIVFTVHSGDAKKAQKDGFLTDL